MSSKPKAKSKKQQSSISFTSGTKKKADSSTAGSVSTTSSKALSSGYLLTCDPPAKQFILHLNDAKIADKKFILEDLDATHLLIKGEVREEITRKVEEWMDEVSGIPCVIIVSCTREVRLILLILR
jgi:DNA helicase TIP49 (TBP-interacting protein)